MTSGTRVAFNESTLNGFGEGLKQRTSHGHANIETFRNSSCCANLFSKYANEVSAKVLFLFCWPIQRNLQLGEEIL